MGRPLAAYKFRPKMAGLLPVHQALKTSIKSTLKASRAKRISKPFRPKRKMQFRLCLLRLLKSRLTEFRGRPQIISLPERLFRSAGHRVPECPTNEAAAYNAFNPIRHISRSPRSGRHFCLHVSKNLQKPLITTHAFEQFRLF